MCCIFTAASSPFRIPKHSLTDCDPCCCTIQWSCHRLFYFFLLRFLQFSCQISCINSQVSFDFLKEVFTFIFLLLDISYRECFSRHQLNTALTFLSFSQFNKCFKKNCVTFWIVSSSCIWNSVSALHTHKYVYM